MEVVRWWSGSKRGRWGVAGEVKHEYLPTYRLHRHVRRIEIRVPEEVLVHGFRAVRLVELCSESKMQARLLRLLYDTFRPAKENFSNKKAA